MAVGRWAAPLTRPGAGRSARRPSLIEPSSGARPPWPCAAPCRPARAPRCHRVRLPVGARHAAQAPP